MDRPNIEEVNLKTFNTAKLFVEMIIFPLMGDYKKYQRQADFGDADLNQAGLLPEEIREIQRYNGLKGMLETTYNLTDSIKSTVYLHNNKEEIKKIDEIITTIKRLKIVFYENKDRFFIQTYREQKKVDMINRGYFDSVKDIIETCYTNVEILMTRNKLLFADAKDDFKSDQEIMDQISREYTGE